MSTAKFRNVEADPSAPVITWPTEGVMAALERGDINDWSQLAAAVRAEPWGPVARRIENALGVTRPYGVAPLFDEVIARARGAAEDQERLEVARRVAALLDKSGLSRADFAEAAGTSTSRLSTYLNAKVTPSATMLVRMERVAARRSRAQRTR